MYPWVDSLHWTLFKEAVWFLTKLFFVFEILNILGGEAAKSQLTLKITVEIDPFSVQVKFRGHGLNPIIIKLILVTMTKFYTYQFIALNNICLMQCKHKRWCLSWINLPKATILSQPSEDWIEIFLSRLTQVWINLLYWS